MSEPRIMVLCGRSPRHLYVANRLCEAADVLAIVHEAPAQWTWEKLKRNLNPKVFWRKAWRWLRDRKRYAGNPEARFFFGEKPAKLDHPERVHEVPSVSSAEMLALAEAHKPDLVCVFGTSLIKGELLEKFTLVNLHGGLSPEYRGADCTFWALYNGEPEKVGCTLHFIDAGIDTGRLIAHVCPEVHPGDDELTLFWRAVRDSAVVYGEAVKKIHSKGITGEIQSVKGSLYQVKDRTWGAEKEMERRLEKRPLPELIPRCEWFGT